MADTNIVLLNQGFNNKNRTKMGYITVIRSDKDNKSKVQKVSKKTVKYESNWE